MKNFVRILLTAPLLLLATSCSDDAPAEKADPTAAVEVELGKAFTWNDFSVAEGWQLESGEQSINMEQVDRPFITGEVTNDSAEPRFALFEFVFVNEGALQSTIRCTSEKIPTGETTELGCPGFENVPTDYDLIQVREITR